MNMQAVRSQGWSPSRMEDGLYLPHDASLWVRTKMVYKAMRALEKSVEDPVAGGVINEACDGDLFRAHAAALAQTTEGRALFAEQPALDRGRIDLEALRKLEPGTLGRMYADYYGNNQIQPFESPYEILSDGDFLKKWYRETHDIHHLVTGYGVDYTGELLLQAFVMGNLGLRECAIIITLATLFQPWNITDKRHLPANLIAAYKRGKAAKSLFSVRFDKRFGEPITAIQRDLGLVA